MTDPSLIPADYAQFLAEVKERVRSAQYAALKAVNTVQPLVGEIAWAHNLVILSKCKAPLEREFYLRMPRIHQIENQSYEKSLSGQSNFDQALTPDKGIKRKSLSRRCSWPSPARR
ncbi:MAG: hypothetical protein ACK449_01530 [Planctomycetota bacterium]|jgi:hypothetical protein